MKKWFCALLGRVNLTALRLAILGGGSRGEVRGALEWEQRK